MKQRTFHFPANCKNNTDEKLAIISIEHIGPRNRYFSASLLWIWDPKWEGHGAFQIWLRWKEGATQQEEFVTHTIVDEPIYLYRFEGFQNGFYVDFQKKGDAAQQPRYDMRVLYRQFRPAKINLTMGEERRGMKAVFTE
jgi:hypothetical protein